MEMSSHTVSRKRFSEEIKKIRSWCEEDCHEMRSKAHTQEKTDAFNDLSSKVCDKMRLDYLLQNPGTTGS
jgi:hypothetical protein